ncbi:MAG: aspartate ammonia-lyase, partial [Clostridia bacterium]|nr:aspartate ammonia-lyase [Clostridia bacterium]
VMSQTAFLVIGNDTCITMAAEAGQLELNYAEPILYHKLFESLRAMEGALETFVDRCVSGITANTKRCESLVENSVGIITAICPQVGYQKAAKVAKEAIKTGKSVRTVLEEAGFLSKEEIHAMLEPETMV